MKMTIFKTKIRITQNTNVLRTFLKGFYLTGFIVSESLHEQNTFQNMTFL